MAKRGRLRPPLFFSAQTRPAEAVGTMGFAFYTPYFTPSPLLGTGVFTGSYNGEEGRQLTVQQVGQQLSYGGLFSGTLAYQPLSAESYLKDQSS